MTEKYFPFTSKNDDRLYASSDFREFFRSILGSGRCDYPDIGVKAVDSLICSRDLIDLTIVNVSPGACVVKGGAYLLDSIKPITIELPTGTTVKTSMIVARLDVDDLRNISIIEVSTVDQTSDLLLATITSDSTQIITIENSNTVAYFKPDYNSQGTINEFRLVDEEPTDQQSAAEPKVVFMWGE